MLQDNFNPEKEPTPERKWWNVFERQSEFEQPVEERRAERAKELKSATKERGHFWERFFAEREESDEIQEIAPKGEKVRKKWRALLRRKSTAQIEDFKDAEPDTIDSYWLAQLMVAERILTLHEQLPQTEPKSRERKDTKTELDVLGLLSEKLSDPEIKVPTEIEQTYQSIIKVIEAGDGDIDTADIPIIQETTEPEIDEPEQTRSRSFQRYGAAVIIALTIAVKKHEAKDEPTPDTQVRPQQTNPGPGIGPVGPTPDKPPEPLHERPAIAQPHNAPNILPHVALTAAVITAEKEYRVEERRIVSPIPLIQQPPAERPRLSATPVETRLDVTEEVASFKPEKKFDHMSMLELLQIAQNVSIGNGQYLARAYQDGKIDRDGLIAVLKSVGRKGNYQYEFRSRSAEYISLKNSQKQPSIAHTTIVDTPHDNQPAPNEPTTVKHAPQPRQHPYYQKLQTKLNETIQQNTFKQTLRVVAFVAVVVFALWFSLR